METPETLKVLKQFPLAAEYLKANHYVVIVTPEDARPKELQTSTSLVINPSDRKIPNNNTIHELFSYCSEVADVLDIEDFQLGIRVEEEGNQTIREIRLDDSYPIRARTPDGQRIDVYFETYDEFMTLYQHYFKSKIIDTLFKGEDSSKRGALLISDNPPPEGWTGKSITKSQLMGYGEKKQNSNDGERNKGREGQTLASYNKVDDKDIKYHLFKHLHGFDVRMAFGNVGEGNERASIELTIATNKNLSQKVTQKVADTTGEYFSNFLLDTMDLIDGQSGVMHQHAEPEVTVTFEVVGEAA